MKIAVVFGTRPEIIKLSVLVKLAASSPGVGLEIIHTGQHYSYNLSERFLEDLGLPHIKEDIAVGSMERLDQLRRMVAGLEVALENACCDLVTVQGDTNSTLAGAIAGRNLSLPVA
ncbi:MAG: UDP-N-acetylglucosamine 2-epimerase, partial [Actinobacteria bacterium]|nr:UDP-N-acetylglucosamine 2-epimerase [Actinomycetota bacterium]